MLGCRRLRCLYVKLEEFLHVIVNIFLLNAWVYQVVLVVLMEGSDVLLEDIVLVGSGVKLTHL